MMRWSVTGLERGLTINSTIQQFSSSSFSYTAIDTPGCLDYSKNMLSTTALADIAILVVAAVPGEFEAGIESGRTRELALCCFTMGIKNIVVLVTKMDDPSVEYSSSRFEEVRKTVSAFLKEVGYKTKEAPIIPVSGLLGDNLSTKSSAMSWYEGASAVESLDSCGPINRPAEKPLRLPVLKVHDIADAGMVIVGRVETGTLKVGMKLVFSPTGQTAEVESIRKGAQSITEAKGGEVVGASLGGVPAGSIRRGMVASSGSNDPAADAESFLAQIVVLHHPGEIRQGYCPQIAVGTAQVPCEFEELLSKIDRKTGKEIEKNPESVKTGEVLTAMMRPRLPVCVEPFSAYPTLGRFAVRDHQKTVAVGVVKEVTKRPIPKVRTGDENTYFSSR